MEPRAEWRRAEVFRQPRRPRGARLRGSTGRVARAVRQRGRGGPQAAIDSKGLLHPPFGVIGGGSSGNPFFGGVWWQDLKDAKCMAVAEQ